MRPSRRHRNVCGCVREHLQRILLTAFLFDMKASYYVQ